jgi:hypothetical protein
MPLHLIKLAVGTASLADLRARQPHCHRTRNFPRRRAELLDGGSLYWVIDRLVTARQALQDIRQGSREDGTPCAELILHPAIIPVRPLFTKPFQGWRYLEPEAAPADAESVAPADALPAELQRELAALGLL